MEKKRWGFSAGEAVIPGIALLFVVLYLVQTLDGPRVAIKWPYTVLVITVIFWLIILVRFVFKSNLVPQAESRLPLKKPVMMVFSPLVYLVVIPWLGFSLSSFLFQAILFRLLGSRSWRSNLTVAFLMTLFLHIVLIVLLNMPMPRLTIGEFSI